MPVATEQDMFAALQQRAEIIGVDVKSTYPDMDTSYDLYVEKVLRVWYGLINMGEAYQQVFVWNVHRQEWEEAPEWDYHYIEDLILKQRGAIT